MQPEYAQIHYYTKSWIRYSARNFITSNAIEMNVM